MTDLPLSWVMLCRIAAAITLFAVANMANAVDLVDVQSQVFTPSCALSTCHNGTQPPNLTAGQSFSSIVNMPSGQSSFDYIEPGSPAFSYLVAKIEGTGFGSQMPLIGGPLSSSKIQLVRDWVTGGALENEVTPPPDPDPVDATPASSMPVMLTAPVPALRFATRRNVCCLVLLAGLTK